MDGSVLERMFSWYFIVTCRFIDTPILLHFLTYHDIIISLKCDADAFILDYSGAKKVGLYMPKDWRKFLNGWRK